MSDRKPCVRGHNDWVGRACRTCHEERDRLIAAAADALGLGVTEYRSCYGQSRAVAERVAATGMVVRPKPGTPELCAAEPWMWDPDTSPDLAHAAELCRTQCPVLAQCEQAMSDLRGNGLAVWGVTAGRVPHTSVACRKGHPRKEWGVLHGNGDWECVACVRDRKRRGVAG